MLCVTLASASAGAEDKIKALGVLDHSGCMFASGKCKYLSGIETELVLPKTMPSYKRSLFTLWGKFSVCRPIGQRDQGPHRTGLTCGNFPMAR